MPAPTAHSPDPAAIKATPAARDSARRAITNARSSIEVETFLRIWRWPSSNWLTSVAPSDRGYGVHNIRRMRLTRRRRIADANSGPNRFHQNRTVPWLMSMPRSNTRSSTLRNDSGNRTYIITARRMISGEELKYRNGFTDLLIHPIYRPHRRPAILL